MSDLNTARGEGRLVYIKFNKKKCVGYHLHTPNTGTKPHTKQRISTVHDNQHQISSAQREIPQLNDIENCDLSVLQYHKLSR